MTGEYTMTDVVCGLTITQEADHGYKWVYSQEDAAGDVPHGNAGTVAWAIDNGLPVVLRESVKQGGKLAHLTLVMRDGRTGQVHVKAAGTDKTPHQLARILVDKLA